MPSTNRALTVCVVLVVFVMSLLTLISSVSAQENPLPAPTGPYMVGTTRFHWIDEARDETYTDDPDDQRELMVQFWYPADAADIPADAVPEAYIPDADIVLRRLNQTNVEYNAPFDPIAPEDLASLQSHAFPGVPLSGDASSYPVLLFSPGFLGIPAFYRAQIEELASHGYIVVGINHPYVSVATVFPDGRVAEHSFPPMENRDGIVVWVEDQKFVLDQLEALNADDPEGMFTGRLNMEQVGIFGHSFGGVTAAEVCAEDTRCRAVLNEDGPLQAGVAVYFNGLDQPLMRLYGEGGGEPNFYNRARNPIYELAIDGFLHDHFADFPLWPVGGLPNDGSVPANVVDPVRATQVVNAYVLAFFDHYLKGEDEPLLDGPSADYPEVDFESANT